MENIGMEKKMISFITSLLVIFSMALNQSIAEPEQSKREILFWGFDRVLLGEIKGQTASIRKISVGDIDNIISVSTSEGMISVVGFYLPRNSSVYSLVLTDINFKKIIKLLDRDTIFGMGMSHDAKYIAFLDFHQSPPYPNKAAYDISIYDISKRTDSVLVRKRAESFTSLSWQPEGKQIAYTSIDGTIETVNTQNGKINSLVEGKNPAWSPDGREIAYYKNDTEIYLYDLVTAESKRVYSRYFWQTPISGELYWSPDGRYLSFAVISGITGKGLECIVLDVESKKSFPIYDGGYWCGPWLSASSSTNGRLAALFSLVVV
jgi:hypothetical protein